MSYRTAPLTYRPGAAGTTSSRSEMESMAPCKWCGQLAGFGQGDVLHVDESPGGRSWAEHGSCQPKPRRDWLTDGRIQ